MKFDFKKKFAGESGSGKSHLLNLLLNSPGEAVVFFREGDGAEPCTLQPQVQ
jgi:ABC-type lipoprotein export system ATPase subunit